ncbi:uncharacterized protein LOC110461229 isoform X2 [Mizuhopecten yessoensis]|uniref:uncharacterized protein LOC110461229 isoform X2 n=1 Tax=Mizuhopecten yessoensis TaxID=6573 RepID=UPI000B45D4B2|nr:uncharacterized protein LOC110461229 isoform X2 [Mizuhopecten yessoensis]
MAVRRQNIHGVVLGSILTMHLLSFRHVGALTFNTDCQPTNCSQGKRNPLDSYFDCSIGMFQEWEEFKKNNHVFESYEQSNSHMKDLNSPSISAVGFYLIADKYNVKNNPNLNLTFRLPRNSSYDTKALLVKFVGLNDPRYPELIDPYYKDNPRYRLFDFPLYKTPEQDQMYPREIVYGCLMGLDCQSEKRAYIITLTAYTLNRSHPGTSITYHFTVYTTRDFSNSGKVTIAMAYIYQLRTMHVVFEPISAVYVSPGTYYFVRLMEINAGKLQTVKIGHTTSRYEHEFPNITKGSYIVEVNVQNCLGINPCPVSQSGIVEVEYQIKAALPTTETSQKAGVYIYAIIGVVGGVVLLLVLLACFIGSIDHKPKVYILNSCEEKIHTDVSLALQQCIHPFFDTAVVSTVNRDSVKDLSTKAGFQNHDNVIIAIKCHHVSSAFVNNLCSKRTLKRFKNITFIWFSQTDLSTVPDIYKVFMWNQNNGCTDMLKYIHDKQKRHCLNILKQFRPQLKNVNGNSAEIQHLRRTMAIALTLPVPTPANDPWAMRPYSQDDLRRPLIQNNCCPVHHEMCYEMDNHTQSFNVPSSPGYNDNQTSDEWHFSSLPIRDDLVEGHHFGRRLDHGHPEITSSDIDILSQEMLRINGAIRIT